MKRIQNGPVRGISLKLQEEERERRMDFIPERSAVDVDEVEVDVDTRDMLRALNMNVSNLTVQTQVSVYSSSSFFLITFFFSFG